MVIAVLIVALAETKNDLVFLKWGTSTVLGIEYLMMQKSRLIYSLVNILKHLRYFLTIHSSIINSVFC